MGRQGGDFYLHFSRHGTLQSTREYCLSRSAAYFSPNGMGHGTRCRSPNEAKAVLLHRFSSLIPLPSTTCVSQAFMGALMMEEPESFTAYHFYADGFCISVLPMLFLCPPHMPYRYL